MTAPYAQGGLGRFHTGRFFNTLSQRVALTAPLTQGSLGRMEVAGVGMKKTRSEKPNGVNYAM